MKKGSDAVEEPDATLGVVQGGSPHLLSAMFPSVKPPVGGFVVLGDLEVGVCG